MRNLGFLAVVCLLAATTYADIINIATVGSGETGSGWKNIGTSTSTVVGQTFVVDSGYKCTNVSAYIEKGTDATVAYIASIQICKQDKTLVASASVSSANFVHWLSIDVDLEAGSYYWQVTGNNTTFKNKMFVWNNVSNPYPDGAAFQGWNIASPITGSDFASTFTVEAIPEPTTLALVGISGIIALVRRRR